MEFVTPKDSPDKLDSMPSFRKPSNDSANRKYRHHSPIDESDSSSLEGSPKHGQSIGTAKSSANRSNTSENSAKMNHGKKHERDPSHSHSSRTSDSHRYSDKPAYRSSREYQHGYDGGYRRLADDEDKDSTLHSKYDQEVKGGRSECAKHGESYEKLKETSENADRNRSRDKYEASGYRSKDKDREANALERRYTEKESSRQISSRRDHKRADEQDRLRERDGRDDRRTRHRSPIEYWNESSTFDDGRRHGKDTFTERDGVIHRLKESQRMEVDDPDYRVHKRRYEDKDAKKYEKYSLDFDENRKKDGDSLPAHQAREEKSDAFVDKYSKATEEQGFSSKRSKFERPDKFPSNMTEGKPSSSLKEGKEGTDKLTIGHIGLANSPAEAAQDLNTAKVAALKAAELVNRNLVGTGFMSTDQKKKLLWGSKKNSSEEVGNRWDLQLFPDRERQEKFNKLMGVKGDAIPPERKPDEKDVEKQKEVQIDLEKQYTAGLRRRDGRTVGLGL